MKVYNNKIYSINFDKKSITPKIIDKSKKIAERENFYDDISKFLNKEYSKQEYFSHFLNNTDTIIKNKTSKYFSKAEKIYINNLFTTLDLHYDIDSIPDEYLAKKMQELLQKTN